MSTHCALIWGGRGWIGSMFKEILIDRKWIVIDAESRADSRQDVINEIMKYNPSHIICCIGRTYGPGFATIDYLEQKGKLKDNINDNLYGPLTLASIAKEKSLHMLYFGTGCIFQYDDLHTIDSNIGFLELDDPNFFGSSYSAVKGYTDRIMREQYSDIVLNVRIRMPISSVDSPRNFISKIIAYQRICNIPNSMTVLDDILPILEECMSGEVVGTLNATNPGLIDHNTILTWYRDLQNPSHQWTNITNEELVTNVTLAGRSNNYLDTTKLSTLFPTVPNIQDSVRKLLENHQFAGRTSK